MTCEKLFIQTTWVPRTRVKWERHTHISTMSDDAKSPQGNVAELKLRLADIKYRLSKIPQQLKEAGEMKKQLKDVLTTFAGALDNFDVEGNLAKAVKLAEDAKGDFSKLGGKILREYARAHRNLVVTLPKKRKDLGVELMKTQKALGEAVLASGNVTDTCRNTGA